MASPIDAVDAGVLSDASGRVEDVELPLIRAQIRRDEGGQDGVRCLTGAQPRHRVDSVHRIDQRLGRERGDVALHMRADGADGEETGGNRDAKRAGGGVARED